MEQRVPDQSNTGLARLALALMICVLATAIAVAYLWLHPPGYARQEMVFISGELGRDLDLYKADQFGRHRVRLTKSAGYELFPTWSPDGGKLAFLRTGALDGPTSDEEWELSGIFLMSFEGSKPTEQLLAGARDVGIGVPSWSPDGRTIGVLSQAPSGVGRGPADSTLTFIDLESRTQTQVPLTVTAMVMERALSWSPDGTHVAFGARAKAADGKGADNVGQWGCVYDLEQGKLTELVPDVLAIQWSLSGGRLACQYQDEPGRIHLVSPDGTAMRTLEIGEYVSDIAWSPDGAKLALSRESGGDASDVVIVHVAEGQPAVYPLATNRLAGYLSWSSDGRYLGYTSLSMDQDEQPEASLHVIDVESDKRWALTQAEQVNGMLAWRPVIEEH